MEVLLPELKEIQSTLKLIIERLDNLESRQLPQWVTLEQACTWKGVNAKTIQQPGNRHLMPPKSERRLIGGRYKWSRETILDWSIKTDELLEYIDNQSNILKLVEKEVV